MSQGTAPARLLLPPGWPVFVYIPVQKSVTTVAQVSRVL